MDVPLPVTFSDDAASEIAEADAWWREHRPAVPDAVEADLATAIARISHHPGAAPRADHAGLTEVRRVLLPRIGFHLYYRIRPSHADIEVVAFWHARRR